MHTFGISRARVMRNLAARRFFVLLALALLIATLLLVARVTPTAGQGTGGIGMPSDDHGVCVCWISNQSIHGSIGVTATPQPEPTLAPQS